MCVRWITVAHTTGDPRDELDCVVEQVGDRRLVDAALESIACIGRDSELASRRANSLRIECSDLEQDVSRALGDFTALSTDYTGGLGAPDYRNIVGEGLLEKPDGSVFRMVMYDSERFWVSYNKTATTVPIVTITIGAFK